MKALSQNTPLSIGLAVMLLACAFWLGRLSNTTERQSQILEKHDRILSTLSEIAADNKRRLDWIDKRDIFRSTDD